MCLCCYFSLYVCPCVSVSHIKAFFWGGGVKVGADCGFQNHHPVLQTPVSFACHLWRWTCFLSKTFPCSSSHGCSLTTINPAPHSSTTTTTTPTPPCSIPPPGPGRKMVSITFTLDWVEPDVARWVLCNVMMKPGWLSHVSYPSVGSPGGVGWSGGGVRDNGQTSRRKYDAAYMVCYSTECQRH